MFNDFFLGYPPYNVQRYMHPYDAKVEWLKSTGTQYIDTLINPAVSPMVVADIELTNTADTDYWGNNTTGLGAASYIADFANWALMYYRYGSSSYASVPVQIQGRHLVEIGKTVTYDGDLKYTSPNTYQYDANKQTILLFKSRRGNAASFTCYSWKLYDGNDLVRDFIPVRIMNNSGVSEGAMWDNVEMKLFKNLGTGSFQFGPDKNVEAENP